MARKFDLRKYQEEILARIDRLDEAGASVSMNRLGVGIGQARVLINLDEISEVIPVPDVTAVPLTRPWFLGVANVRGILFSIADLVQLNASSADMVAPTQIGDNSRVLLFHEQYRQQAGILVDRVVGLRNISQMKLKESSTSVPFWAKQNEYEDENGAVWQELDIEALITSREFTQPGLG